MTSASVSEAWLQVQPPDPASGARIIKLHGALTVSTTGRIWRELRKLTARQGAFALRLDLSELEYADTSGLALLAGLDGPEPRPDQEPEQETGQESGQESGQKSGLDTDQRGDQAFAQRRTERGQGRIQMQGLRADLTEQLRHFQELSQTPIQARTRPGFLERVGRSAMAFARDVRELVGFVGAFSVAFGQAMRRPGSIRWRDTWLVCEAVGANAVGIIALIGFLMGLIISFQSAMPLRMFGAEIYVARLLGLSMLREMGPLVTAIILAGRSGASFAAELGTMKINDELNALQTMGLDPMRLLVVPRMLAAMCMTPMLAMVFNLFSLIGGAVVMLSLGYPLVTYMHQVTMSVGMGDLLNGLFKAFVFSILVGWIGCVRGLQTGQGAWAVGAATTSAVVSAIIMIAVMDGIFAVLFYVFNY